MYECELEVEVIGTGPVLIGYIVIYVLRVSAMVQFSSIHSGQVCDSASLSQIQVMSSTSQPVGGELRARHRI